jgi:predicted nucleic acid-binding protein
VNVYWDTNLFIYLFEDYGELTRRSHGLISRIRARGDRLVTSTFALGEMLVLPVSAPPDLARDLERRLHRIAEVVAFDLPAARHFAAIRADRSIAEPDAIHLACAAAARVDLFVTNDARLSRRVVPGVPILTSLGDVPI